MKVYIVIISEPYEGYNPPIGVYTNRAKAKSIVKQELKEDMLLDKGNIEIMEYELE